MRRSPALVALLLCATRFGDASAQALSRGLELPDEAMEARQSQRMREEMALLRQGGTPGDAPSTRAQMESFFSRLPGRFRIDGLIEQGFAAGKQTGKITGVADCAGVGEGLGVHCIINATWPVIDVAVAQIGARESPSEMLKTFRPAVLVLGVDADAVRIRALLVTADSISHGWAGLLGGDTLVASRVAGCKDNRCFQPLQITAEPNSEIVTLRLDAQADVFTSGDIHLTFTMHRDAAAKASKKLKSLKAR